VRACLQFARFILPIGLMAALAACSMWRSPPSVDASAEIHPPMDPKVAVANGFRAVEGANATAAIATAAVANGFKVVEEADPTVAAVPDPEVLQAQAEIIRGGGHYRVGAPYEIAGKLYEPAEDPASPPGTALRFTAG
jgi:hypothetical protein